MIAEDPNVELLIRMVEALGDLHEQFVFVGGCATALLITDPAAPRVRATHDVDAIVAIVSLPGYQRLGKILRERGFVQTLETGEPPYRWVYAGMQLDVMPVSEMGLGFSNRWYESAMRKATAVRLREELEIQLVSPAHFVATKLEAFEDRGKSDYLESHDLEDVLSVIDGRPELVAELAQAEPSLREYVAGVFARLVADAGFLNALPGLILEGSPAERMPVVMRRLRAIAGLSEV
jgi:predicted nucleotidyltransferase